MKSAALALLIGVWTGPAWAAALNDALDTDDLDFEAIGNGSLQWVMDLDETHDGVDAMRSPVVPAPPVGSQSYFGIQSEVDGPAEVLFWWRREGGGELRVFVDHSWTASMPAGGDSWTQASVAVGLGRHHLQWRTDISSGTAADGVFWLDAVEVLRPPLAITTSGLTEGEVGQPFTFQITTTHPASTFDAVPLPAGLTIDGKTGWITGVPTLSGETLTRLSAATAEASAEATIWIRIRPPEVSLAEALDGEGLVWSVSPEGTVWRGRNLGGGQDAAFPDQARQVYFPEVPDYPSFRLQTSLAGPEVVTFAWVPASAGLSNDGLTLFVDNKQVSPRYVPGLPRGEWRDERIEVSPGEHTLRWEHSGADWASTGLDRVIRSRSRQLCLPGPRQYWFSAGSPVHERIPTNRPAMAFGATGLPPGLYLEPATGIVRGTPTTAGDWVCDVTASSGADSASMKLVLSITELDLGEALGQSHRVWTQQNAGWQPWGAGGVVRFPSLQGDGAPGSTETTSFETEVIGPDHLTFDWDCSYSFVLGGIRAVWELVVDGVPARSLSSDTGEAGVRPGTMGWKTESFSVPGGRHRLQWRFTGSRAQSCCPPGVQGMVRALRFDSDGTTYAAWAVRAGLPELEAGRDQDADGDGLLNWAEYVLQSNPIAVDAPPAPLVVASGSFLEFEFPLRPGGATDLAYAVEEAISLGPGAWVSSSASIVLRTPDRLIVRSGPPGTEAPAKFFRLVGSARP